MIGAIIGDIVGSRFEFQDHYGKDFALFTSGCRFTDDNITAPLSTNNEEIKGEKWKRNN